MQKVVANKMHGGFGLSHAGVLFYADRKGLKIYPERGQGEDGFWYYWLVPESDRNENSETLEERGIARDDPALVATIEVLGDVANGPYANLSVIEIPDDVEWVIQEYGGLETIAEAHRVW